MHFASSPLFASIVAAADDADPSAGSVIMQYGILLLIPVAMYFLLIRPQRKRAREQMEMQKALGVGDEIVTTSGIYGFITGEEDNLFWLEIDDDVQIRIAKAAVANKVSPKPDSSVKPAGKAEQAADAADADKA